VYIPKHFKVEDRTKIFNFIDDNSFGTLVSMQDDRPVASHLPFLLDREEEYLYSHFARLNDQWKSIESQESLIIFQGPHTYVSSSWYETNQSVPTWNYVAVHVYGRIEIIKDKKEVLSSLEKLVLKYEEPNGIYKLDESNNEFIEGLSRGIVVFRMKVDRLEGKWKLSQNHSEDRQRKVINKLEQSKSEDARNIAELMKKNI